MANPPNTRSGRSKLRKIQEDVSGADEGSRRAASPPPENSRRSTRQNSKQIPLDSFLAPRSSSPFDSPVASGTEDGPHSAKRQRQPPKNSSLALETKGEADPSSGGKDLSESNLQSHGTKEASFPIFVRVLDSI